MVTIIVRKIISTALRNSWVLFLASLLKKHIVKWKLQFIKESVFKNKETILSYLESEFVISWWFNSQNSYFVLVDWVRELVGKIHLAWGHEHSKVCVSWPKVKYFPNKPHQTQSIGIITTKLLKFQNFFCVKLYQIDLHVKEGFTLDNY